MIQFQVIFKYTTEQSGRKRKFGYKKISKVNTAVLPEEDTKRFCKMPKYKLCLPNLL